jgi:hypothetical protein
MRSFILLKLANARPRKIKNFEIDYLVKPGNEEGEKYLLLIFIPDLTASAAKLKAKTDLGSM